uniref:calmodulin-binding receptor-like cytoplasmic kinase 2 n=1 Tax=Erigeron canadensis TaxID=72917 RepID=UPI001CB9B349|nr:calmodulin-binding receptor-like cytoplasmic kinase 2 [Erigeron canadensis]
MDFMTQYRTLDITLISALVKSLPYDSKQNIYAVVSLRRLNHVLYKERTPLVNPNSEWNHPMKVNIVETSAQKNQLTLVVKIKSVGLFWDKKLGRVKIPIKELSNGCATKQGKTEQFDLLRYGEDQGHVILTYEFGEIQVPKSVVNVLQQQRPASHPPLNLKIKVFAYPKYSYNFIHLPAISLSLSLSHTNIYIYIQYIYILSRKDISGMHTPNQFSYPPSSPSPSSYSSTHSSEKSTGRRNRVKVAAKSVAGVFVSCFTPPEDETHHHSSSAFCGSDAFSSTSEASDSTEGKKRAAPRGIYATRNDSTHNREPGSTKFTMAEIHKATKNFSPALKVGQGGFGTVYKGQLQDGTLVAVKRAKKSIYDKNLGREFQSEVQTLTKVEHLNLVKCYGYLHHGDERIIVVEYVSNGTLREHLECLNGNFLSLASRLDIAIDVAHAITYLHTYTDHPIIHRDIKSSNILLTEKLRAKVADFGFARLAADAELGQTHVSTQVKGTAGYLDPEYLRTYQLTEKSDVYSFGILLVELVTGRRPIEAKRELSERVTAKWAMTKFADGLAISVLDPNLEKSDANGLALEKILELALQCVASHRQNRPTMRRCAEVLWNIRKDYKDLLL